jgi:transposase
MITMNIQNILKPASREQLQSLTRTELIDLLLGEQDIRAQAEVVAREAKEESYLIGAKYIRIKNRIFAPSSEKNPRKAPEKGSSSKKKEPQNRTRLPSDRYPEATILEQEIEIVPLPSCSCCGSEMSDSGMNEVTECLSVIPKQFVIKRQIYHKYNCRHCHGSMETAPTLPRIKPGSSYDDEFIIDVGLSKYCDLLPIERYCSIAKRQGFPGLPPHSLIELTHYLACFLMEVYQMIKAEVMASEVLYADETPHRMLEGDKKQNWYLWGFSSETASYFECHDTRSSSVASDILIDSQCKYLVTDVYSGYNKAVTVGNEQKLLKGLPPVQNAYCNAHARRKFKESEEDFGVSFLEQYQEIYRIEKGLKDLSDKERLQGRQELIPIFTKMKSQAEDLLDTVSSKSYNAQAANYFIKNFEGLTKFLYDGKVPIDNNHQERQLRNPVIGRKTWYGTHSRRGAATNAILFSIVETCKLNNINPKTYLQQLVKDIHQKKKPYTPRQAAIEADKLHS